MTKRGDVGKLGESIAVRYLISKGYTILQLNFRLKCGEIDIIASKSFVTHFVEVKSVSRESPIGNSLSKTKQAGYNPLENISPRKMKRISRAVAIYIEKNKVVNWQSDVISVVLDVSSRTAHCELLESVLLSL